jgi:tetratricopeptide (TPR) repeat protein
MLKSLILTNFTPNIYKSLVYELLSFLLTFLGFFDKSLQYIQSALQFDRDTYGENSEQVAHSLYNIAWLYEKQANYSEASKVAEKLLK